MVGINQFRTDSFSLIIQCVYAARELANQGKNLRECTSRGHTYPHVPLNRFLVQLYLLYIQLILYCLILLMHIAKVGHSPYLKLVVNSTRPIICSELSPFSYPYLQRQSATHTQHLILLIIQCVKSAWQKKKNSLCRLLF